MWHLCVWFNQASTLPADSVSTLQLLFPVSECAVNVFLPSSQFHAGTELSTTWLLSILSTLRAQGQLQGKTVLDYGTGTGILGLTALAMGAASVVATETDAQAAFEARTNAELNGFSSHQFQVGSVRTACPV